MPGPPACSNACAFVRTLVTDITQRPRKGSSLNVASKTKLNLRSMLGNIILDFPILVGPLHHWGAPAISMVETLLGVLVSRRRRQGLLSQALALPQGIAQIRPLLVFPLNICRKLECSSHVSFGVLIPARRTHASKHVSGRVYSSRCTCTHIHPPTDTLIDSSTNSQAHFKSTHSLTNARTPGLTTCGLRRGWQRTRHRG